MNVSDDFRTVPLDSACLQRADGEKLVERDKGRTYTVCIPMTEASERASGWWIWKAWRVRDGEESAVYGLQFVTVLFDLSELIKKFKPFYEV